MLTIVGIGPGALDGRTIEAQRALEEADILTGYQRYIALLQEEFPQKPLFCTGMKQEAERCRESLRLSRTGQRVALCCSGDAQVYGMAALVMEMACTDDDIRIIPGVTAALSAAALLGAPLSGDFAVISLSDLLTPWETISRRLMAAGQGDFVIALYNPASKTRLTQLRQACEIIMAYRSGETPCGWVRNIGRRGQEKKLCTLSSMYGEQLDMLTTVIIGNSGTVVRNGAMLTPRGYSL